MQQNTSSNKYFLSCFVKINGYSGTIELFDDHKRLNRKHHCNHNLLHKGDK